jgi:hypothetical protein
MARLTVKLTAKLTATPVPIILTELDRYLTLNHQPAVAQSMCDCADEAVASIKHSWTT